MALVQSLSRAFICLSLLGLTHCRVVPKDRSGGTYKGCDATFREGETAELKFPIQKSALDHEDFFAHLRRSDGTEIVICDRNSPISCTVFDSQYESGGIVNESFTFRIPSVSQKHEDDYELQVYISDKPEPPMACRLTVQGIDVSRERNCSAPIVAAGNTGKLSFFLGSGLFSHDNYLVRLRRAAYKESDIIICDPDTSAKCKVQNPRYRSDGIKNGTLTLWIPDMTPGFEDTYILQVYDGDPPEFPIMCRLIVTGAGEDAQPTTKDTDGASQGTLIAIVVVVIVLAVVIIVSTIFIAPKIKRRLKRTHSNLEEKNHDASKPLLSKEAADTSNREKGWYYETMSREDEKALLKYRRNGPGSFLIRQRITNPAHFTLSVVFEGEIQRFTIVPEDSGLRCFETDGIFATLTELVDYYHKHDIQVGDKTWGKLSKPLQKELEEEWYFGHISDADEAKLLKTEDERTGRFLIKDGTLGLHDYVLSVHVDGTVKRFPIVQGDSDFKMLDTGDTFSTLSVLVDTYKNKDIQTGLETVRLTESANKEPEEEWYHNDYKDEDEIKLLQSKRKQQGHFLIAPGNTNPYKYVLRVFFQKEWRRFLVRAERCGYMFVDMNLFFHSWHDLVDYFRNNDIKQGDRVWGKLTKPLQKEPQEKWYYGDFSRKEEQELLKVAGNGAGAFLIRNGVTDPDDYVLTVNAGGTLHHFIIEPERHGFRLRETDDVFTTLSKLVDHFKENDIKVGEQNFGKLTTPFKRMEADNTANTILTGRPEQLTDQHSTQDIYD